MKLNYEYSSLNDILYRIKAIQDFGIIELLVLIAIIFVFILLLLYIFPIFFSIKEYYFKMVEKKRKKIMLKRIILQKEIEDEIFKEIK